MEMLIFVKWHNNMGGYMTGKRELGITNPQHPCGIFQINKCMI